MLVLGDGAQDDLEEGAGAFEWDGVGSDGIENATDCAQGGVLVGKRTEADGGVPARLLTTQLPLVGEASAVSCESDSAAGRSIGL
jgi:hypothetical protein